MSFPSGPVMVWELTGRPTRNSLKAEPIPAVCAMCGRDVDESVHVKHSIGGKSFTDQYHLRNRDSDRTCYPCAWVCTGKPPDTIRNWTIAARLDREMPPNNPKVAFPDQPHLWMTSKDDFRAVVDLLADPPRDGSPWLVAVADTGQKHTVPFTTVNYGAGRWRVQMDSARVTATPEEFRHVLGHVLRLKEPPVRFAVKDLRKRAGMSVQKCASAAGLTVEQVTSIESGRVLPGPDHAAELERALGVPTGRLRNGPGASMTHLISVTPPPWLDEVTLPVWVHHAGMLERPRRWAGSTLLTLVSFLTQKKEHFDGYLAAYGASPLPGAPLGYRTGGGDPPSEDHRVGDAAGQSPDHPGRPGRHDRDCGLVAPPAGRVREGWGDGVLF